MATRHKGRCIVAGTVAALAAALLLTGVVSVAAAAQVAPVVGADPSLGAPPPPAAATAGTTSAAACGWVLQLRGPASPKDLTYRQFAALAKYRTTWNDGTHTWAGVPLWRLVGMVDDKDSSTFSSTLAKKGYAVQVVGLSGAVTLQSTDGLWAKKNVLIADQVDGAPLPFGILGGSTWTPAWPAQLVGPGLAADQDLGGVVRIVVYKPGLTPPASPSIVPGWVVQVRGGLETVDDTAAQFRALAKAHPAPWTDTGTSTTYTGTALWRLVAQADGGSAATLNLDLLGLGYLAQPGVGYGVDVVGMGASADATVTFTASQFAGSNGTGSNGVVLADRQGSPLAQLTPLAGTVTQSDSTYSWAPTWPLRLCGGSVTSDESCGGVLRVVIHRPPVPSYVKPLVLAGRRTAKIAYLSFPTPVTWDGRKAGDINPQLRALYRGQTLSRLIGLVDDANPKTFNATLARKGYKIEFIASDGYKWTIGSKTIVGKTHWIVASLKDGATMSPGEGPYRFVGSFIKPFYGKQSVYKLKEIKLIF